MSPEGLTPVPPEEIGPEKNVPAETQERREARREREGSLSGKILEWYGGDSHTHTAGSTRWGYPEGLYEIEEALPYAERLGLKFVAFAEHSSQPGNPEILSPEHPISQSLIHQAEKITQLNREGEGKMVAFSAVEVNIMFDQEGEPTLDLPPAVLEKLDLVIASRHGIAREKDFGAIRESLLSAVRNPRVGVIGHPDRHIQIKGDWHILRDNIPEAKALDEEMARRQGELSEEEIRKNYWNVIDKAIGKREIEPGNGRDERLMRIIQAREDLERPYWEMWEEVLAEMKREGKAFEINLNEPPQPELLRRAVGAGVRLMINYDAHEFTQFKESVKEVEDAKKHWAGGELSEDDRRILEEYKGEKLSEGPGVKAILRMARTIRTLESLDATPNQVINSSRESLLSFLSQERGKKTENLEYLTSPLVGNNGNPALE